MISNKSKLISACLALLLCIFTSIAAYAGPRFNFAYRITGEIDLKPVQAFDDGAQTFLLMKGSVVPAVFVDAEGKSLMLQVKQRGQYLVIPAIATGITVKFGRLSAKVTYTSTDRPRTVIADDALMRQFSFDVETSAGALDSRSTSNPPTYGATKPLIGDSDVGGFIDRDSLIPFAKGKSTLSKEASIKVMRALTSEESGHAAKVVVTGRDDQVNVEGLGDARAIAIRDFMIAAGVPLDRIVMKHGAARDSDTKIVNSDLVMTWKAKPVSGPKATTSAETILISKWSVKAADGDVKNMLQRWADDAGWRLVWQNAPEIKITGDAELSRDGFVSAADYVLVQSRSRGYRIKAKAFNNKVLVVSGD